MVSMKRMASVRGHSRIAAARSFQSVPEILSSAHHSGILFQSRLRMIMLLAHNHTVLNGIGASAMPVFEHRLLV